MRFSHRGHSPGYLARKQPLLSDLGLLRSSAQAEASSSWSRRSLALLRPLLLLCLLVLLFLVVLLFLLILFLLVRGLLVLFCLVKRCNTQFDVHRWDIGHSWVVLLCPR